MLSLNYIGSKKTLIPKIYKIIQQNIPNISQLSFADLFAGTGIVGYTFRDICRKIIANDLEYYSSIIIFALLKCEYSTKLSIIIEELNNINFDVDELIKDKDFNINDYLIYKNYSENNECERMFWTNKNALFADIMMHQINQKYANKDISGNERKFLIASLIVSIDKYANTSCVYGAYLKKYKTSAEKLFKLEPIHKDTHILNKKNNIIYSDFAENIVNDISNDCDIIYLDPPYNHRQYAANYSPLNFIAKYNEDVKLKGISGLITNYNKSAFSSKTNVKKSFTEMIKNISSNCKYIILSYNNEGLLNFDTIKNTLLKRGNVILYKIEYNKFKSNKNVKVDKVYEYLWFVYCMNKNNEFYEIELN